MALVKKLNDDWKPSENKGLQVGDTIEISDYRRLVELGHAELVDEQGNVLPLPGTIFVCGICYEKINSHSDYIDHIMNSHATQVKHKIEKPEVEPEVEKPEEEFNIAKELKKSAKKPGRPKKNA